MLQLSPAALGIVTWTYTIVFFFLTVLFFVFSFATLCGLGGVKVTTASEATCARLATDVSNFFETRRAAVRKSPGKISPLQLLCYMLSDLVATFFEGLILLFIAVFKTLGAFFGAIGILFWLLLFCYLALRSVVAHATNSTLTFHGTALRRIPRDGLTAPTTWPLPGGTLTTLPLLSSTLSRPWGTARFSSRTPPGAPIRN